MPREHLPVLIEAATKRVFACAVDWPGLARSGRTEADAIDALLAALPRYEAVAAAAGLAFPAGLGRDDVAVVERVEGNATTDFGAPGIVGEVDRKPVSAPEARRQAALVEAAWAVLAAVATSAPEELRKGPRGGGRDRSKIVAHVHDAERGYASVMGIPGASSASRGQAVLRAEMLELLGRPSDGSPLAGKRWPARYAARRVAWHALDHAWEIEDRSSPP